MDPVIDWENDESSWRHDDVTVTSMDGLKCRVLVGGRCVSVDRVQLLQKHMHYSARSTHIIPAVSVYFYTVILANC